MFDFERAVQEWKRKLRKLESLEDGYVTELESHLRDEFDAQKRLGSSDEDAFAKAAALVGQPEDVGADYYKTNDRSLSGRPPRDRSRFSPLLFCNYFKFAWRRFGV